MLIQTKQGTIYHITIVPGRNLPLLDHDNDDYLWFILVRHTPVAGVVQKINEYIQYFKRFIIEIQPDELDFNDYQGIYDENDIKMNRIITEKGVYL